MANSTDKNDLKQMETMNQPGTNTEKQTLFAILNFLSKNNLKETEALLKKEAKLTEVDLPERTEVQGQSDVTQALAVYKSEGDANLYEEYFSSLKNFIDSSLDIHRCELAMVIYPVFVHMYLELVYNNHEEEAKVFFEKFSADQEYYYQDDLLQLSMVTRAEHMRENQLLDSFKANRFTIRISRDSYNHLKRYLQEKKHTLLLNIIQEHLYLEIFDGIPRTKIQIDATSGGMMGESQKDANKNKVYYGFLKEPEINITLDDDDDIDDDKPKKKKQRKDLSMAKKAKSDPHTPINAIKIPLPEIRDIDKQEKIRAHRESTKRVTLSAENLPSICFYTLLNSYQRVTTVDICEDSSLLCAGFADSQIRVWSLNREPLLSMKPSKELENIEKDSDDVLEQIMDHRTEVDNRTLNGHSGPVYATCFSHDRTQLISSSEDGTVRLWSLQTWTNLVSYKGHIYPVWDVDFSPHGHYFVSSGCDRVARLWATNGHQPLRIFAGHLSDVDCVRFHPNSHYIATGSNDRTVRLWEVASGNCVRVMTGHKGAVSCLEFSPDGRYLVSAGSDKNIFLWDVSNGGLVCQFSGHTDAVLSLAFSREGNILASGGLDNNVRLWDVGKMLEDLEADTQPIFTDVGIEQCLGSYGTKSTPIFSLQFTRRNLLLASGPFTS